MQIREGIERCYKSDWDEVAAGQSEIFLGSEGQLMRQQADRMAATYNLEVM